MEKINEYKGFIENLAKGAGIFLKQRIGKIEKVSYKGQDKSRNRC